MESNIIIIALVIGFVLSLFFSRLKYNRTMSWVRFIAFAIGALWMATLIVMGTEKVIWIVLLTILFASGAIKFGWNLWSDKAEDIRLQQ